MSVRSSLDLLLFVESYTLDMGDYEKFRESYAIKREDGMSVRQSIACTLFELYGSNDTVKK